MEPAREPAIADKHSRSVSEELRAAGRGAGEALQQNHHESSTAECLDSAETAQAELRLSSETGLDVERRGGHSCAVSKSFRLCGL